MLRFFICLCFFILFSCSKTTKKNIAVVARVDKNVLKQNDNRIKKWVSNETTTKQIDNWIEETVLYNAAIEKGFDKDSLILKKRDLFLRNLIISSFLEKEIYPKIKVEKEDIRKYYHKNKMEFQRNTDEIYVNHYISKEIGVAKKIVGFLLSNKNENFLDISPFLHISEYIKKDQVHPLFNNRLFKKNAKIIGPIERNKEYHVFDIIENYEKGSFVGLDLVYDEVYHRLYKKEEIIKKNLFINKLKKEVNIYINPKYNIK